MLIGFNIKTGCVLLLFIPKSLAVFEDHRLGPAERIGCHSKIVIVLEDPSDVDGGVHFGQNLVKVGQRDHGVVLQFQISFAQIEFLLAQIFFEEMFHQFFL